MGTQCKDNRSFLYCMQPIISVAQARQIVDEPEWAANIRFWQTFTIQRSELEE